MNNKINQSVREFPDRNNPHTFIKASKIAHFDNKLSKGAKHLLITLENYNANKINPTREELATTEGIQIRQISNLLKELTAQGYIETQRTGRANNYKIAGEEKGEAANDQ